MDNSRKTGRVISYIALILLVAVGSYSLGTRASKKEVKSISQENSSNNDYISNINKNILNIMSKIDNEFLGEFDTQKAEEGIYKGLMESLNDPYSVYFNEKEYKDLNEQTAGEFGGIGVQVSASKGDYIVVIAPIKGTPGEKAGILPGDYITHIEGTPYFSKDMDKAVSVMRGEPNTDVNITIQRGEGEAAKKIDLKITRAIINVDSVFTKMLDNNIGYLQLTGFQEKSAKEFIDGYNKLKAEGAKKIILDLRNNPGGLLNVTLEIADFLMSEKVLINIKDKNGKEEVLKTNKGQEEFELVTLINEGSASASEVLSGSLQDNKRSIIVGKKSFGKGVIQNVYPVYNNGRQEGMKLTIAEFFTPTNKKIHGEGITPDYIVELPENVTQIGVENLENDTQLKKAIELLTK